MGVEAHKGQKRKSGEPYFTHPIAVAHILADMGGDADTLIAALLHDSVEDTDLTLVQIDKEFNGEVAALIDGVTKIYREDLEGRPSLDDQIETLRKIFKLMKQDVRIMVIKLVDRLHNMQTVEFMKPERQKSFSQETMDVFVKIADKLAMHDLRDEMEALCLSVLDPDTFERLSDLRIENEKQSEKVIKKMCRSLQNVLGDTLVDCLQEVKSWQKLRISMDSGDKGITGVAAITATFLCDDIGDCYQILGALHQIWQREHLSFQDFINSPTINGYRGLHTTIILEDGTRVRCKIRTESMQEYHKYGITVECFDSEAIGVFDYLPWAEHLTPLTDDTVDRSDDFWESLQSDILGDSIIIHGMNDHTEMLPEGATALDGVFYCFRNHAQFTKSIRINGEEVSPHTPLSNGVSLDVTFSKTATVDRQWLEWVNTSLATSMIRSTLSTTSKKKKLTIGKGLLQDIMVEQKKGFIEEYDQEELRNKVALLGYRSINDAFIAIADGHTKSIDVYSVLFNTDTSAANTEKKGSTIKFSIQIDDMDVLSRVIALYKRYNITLQNVRLRPIAMFNGHVTIHIPMTPSEQKAIKKDLLIAGATDVTVSQSHRGFWFFVSIAFLLCIWGFDPAVAYGLIHKYDILAIDLMLVRFWTLTIANGGMLLWHKSMKQLPKTRLPIANISLWASALLMISIAYFGYMALQGTIPAHYTIPMTAGGILLTSIVHKKRWAIITLSWALLISGTAFIALFTPSWDYTSIGYMMATVLSFCAFTVVSERYKRQENVGARATEYFFLMSLLCTLITLPMISVSNILLYSNQAIASMILFSFFFAGLPYYMYYFLLSHKQIDFVLRYSFVMIYTTIIGQMLFSGIGYTIDIVTILGALVVTLGAILPMVTKKDDNLAT